MCRKKVRLIILRSLALVLIANAGFFMPGALARPSSDFYESSSESSRRHSRRGLGQPPAAGNQELYQLTNELKQLQNDLSEATLNYETNSQYGSAVFEIVPQPQTAASTDRRHRRPHRLRHEKKRHRAEQGNQRDAAAAVFGGLRVTADLQNERNSFERAADRHSSSLAEHRGAHSYMGVLQTKKRKACPASPSGKERLMCPTRNAVGYDVCINVDQLCDHRRDCPNGEDEHTVNCLFYRTTMGHFKKVVDVVVSLTDHMVRSERTKREL